MAMLTQKESTGESANFSKMKRNPLNPVPCSSASIAPWTIQVPKMFIFPEKFQEIQALLEWLKGYEPSSRIVSFQSVELTPLFLRAIADPVEMQKWGDESDYLPVERGITERDAREIVHELLLAVFDIHNRGIAHGHIHLDNVRKNRHTGRVVILEHVFPVTAIIPNTSYGVNLFLCAAPEIIMREPFGYPVDVWSIGVILHQLLIPDKTFITEDVVGTDLLSPFVMGLDQLTQSFLMLCLKAEPSERPTLAELFSHPFVASTLTCSTIMEVATSVHHEKEISDESSSGMDCSELSSQRLEEDSSSENSDYDSNTSEGVSEVKYIRL